MIPQQGWTIGYFGNVAIKINFSVVFIAFLVTYSLASGILPLSVPGSSQPLYIITGLIGALVFIGSILWHEMAHVLTALRYGIPVTQVVLHLFGGVAQIARDPERPIQEFLIAIAGPVSSLVLAVFFGFLSLLGGLPGALCAWLSGVNLTLVLFNLLPGFPLDGGRVLRSFLWKIGGSYKRATRQASRVGQGMAILFVIGGVIMIINRLAFNGIWFMMIAAFLYAAATASYRAMGSGPMPMETPVSRVMRYNVPVIDPTLPLAILAWRYLDHAPDQAFPVMQNGDLVGLITSRQVERIPRLEWGKFKVSDAMLPREKLIVIRPDDEIAAAMASFDKKGIDHAPVFEGDQLIGMLNRRDIVYRT